MSSKDKSKKKDKKSSSKKKEKSEKKEVASLTPEVKATTTYLGEAHELFQRYDRQHSGCLNKHAFQSLIRDLNGENASIPSALRILTDNGQAIPLGFERTTRNTDFEMGQLFERFDKNHSGALEMDEFLNFFNAYEKQMISFYHQSNIPQWNKQKETSEVQEGQEKPVKASEEKRKSDDEKNEIDHLWDLYQARLNKIHSIIQHSLLPKQTQMKHRIIVIQSEISLLQASSDPTEMESDMNHSKEQQRLLLQQQSVELQKKVDVIDQYLDDVVEKKKNGRKVHIREIRQFLQDYAKIYEFAERLSERNFADPVIAKENNIKSPVVNESISEPPNKPSSSSPPTELFDRYEEAISLLKVKDQMIWELLQERDTLRTENKAIIADVENLNKVSTQEMQEWARLTDEMAAELDRLRFQSLPR